MDQINELQNGLIYYSNILLKIASNDDNDLKKEIKDINSSFEEYTEEYIIDISSVLVYETFDILTKEKRKSLLIELINKNQNFIKDISNTIVNILEKLNFSLYLSYDKYFFDLYTHQTIENNKKAILLTLEYQKQKENIINLINFYSSLPELHKKLLEENEFDIIKFGLKASKDYSNF